MPAESPQSAQTLEQSTDHPQALDAARPGCVSLYRGRTIDTPLTDFGRRVRTIVFASLGGGPVCGKAQDWRASLPRFLGMFTRADVIVYDQREGRCHSCWSLAKTPVSALWLSSVHAGFALIVYSRQSLAIHAWMSPACMRGIRCAHHRSGDAFRVEAVVICSLVVQPSCKRRLDGKNVDLLVVIGSGKLRGTRFCDRGQAW